MNWTNFLLFLTLLYLTYYGLNIMYDYLKSRKPSVDVNDELIFFDDDSRPQLIVPEVGQRNDLDDNSKELIPIDNDGKIRDLVETDEKPSDKYIEFTGGVGLKDMFTLAKGNLILYTGSLIY